MAIEHSHMLGAQRVDGGAHGRRHLPPHMIRRHRQRHEDIARRIEVVATATREACAQARSAVRLEGAGDARRDLTQRRPPPAAAAPSPRARAIR